MSYRLRRGLGTFGTAPVKPVPENCGFDSACIQRNEIASDAYLAAKYIYDYGGPPPSQQGVVVQPGDTPFVNLPPVQTMGANTVDSQGNTVYGTPVQARAVAAPVSTSSSVVPAASIDSSTGAVVATPAVGGFDLSTIPWWGWLAAGGAALFMMGGKR
jgi:hypothetical protein